MATAGNIDDDAAFGHGVDQVLVYYPLGFSCQGQYAYQVAALRGHGQQTIDVMMASDAWHGFFAARPAVQLEAQCAQFAGAVATNSAQT